MKTPIFTNNYYSFATPAHTSQKLKGFAGGTLKSGKKQVKFLIQIGLDCALNNLSLDYITGAELLNYIKAHLLMFVPVAPSEQDGHNADNASGGNDGQGIKFLIPRGLVQKVSRLLIKAPVANAA